MIDILFIVHKAPSYHPFPRMSVTLLHLLRASLILVAIAVAVTAAVDDGCDAEPEWCEVPMPVKSHYGFESPSDPTRWRRAQQAAARGDHSVLTEGLKHFSQPYDFLDGDTAFKYMHYYTDIFLDREMGFSALTGGAVKVKTSRGYWRHDSYDPATRIPVVMAGYGMIRRANIFLLLSQLFTEIFPSRLQASGARATRALTGSPSHISSRTDSAVRASGWTPSRRTSCLETGISTDIRSARSISWWLC